MEVRVDKVGLVEIRESMSKIQQKLLEYLINEYLRWLYSIIHIFQAIVHVLLSTGPNSQVHCCSRYTHNRTLAMGLTTRKTLTVGNGPVLPPKTQHLMFTILAPINYLSSDRLMTWSICTLCSVSRSFTSRWQICESRTNIRRVAIENPETSPKICCYFPAIEWILVWSQIWKWEVEERLKLYNLHIDHVMIWPELRYIIAAKVGGTVK